MKKPRVIAFYLPQYYPTPHNNEWWGEGFTEWTNVAKAAKLYPGHYQPKVPADLGFYDLRMPEVRQKQAEMAKEAGIDGFCYYHYWFSSGHEELDLPFKEVIRLKEPDFPFCLCWANESWYSKFWNKDGVASKKLLAEQKYLGIEDNKAHFYSLLDAFKDSRYMKYENRLIFLIYTPLQFENFHKFKEEWNDLAKQNGLEGFYFIGQTVNANDVNKILSLGFDAINHCHRLDEVFQYSRYLKYVRYGYNFIKSFLKIPYVVPYRYAIKNSVRPEDFAENVYATMMPNWDHTPRSVDGGIVLHNSTPELFKKHAEAILETTRNKEDKNKIVFLKSWNEWGEGNYMEPDLKFGKGYIKALKEVINEY